MKAKEILMTKKPQIHAVKPRDQIREAARLMAEYNIGLVPVLDDNGNMMGVVSERDIVREAVFSQGLLFDQEIQTIMTTNIIVALPDDELAYLTHAMMDKNIRHLPVVDGDELIGILSIKDVVKAIQQHYEGELHHWRHVEAGDYSS